MDERLADQEAWQFEARIRMVSNIGIPHGRELRDFGGRVTASPQQ
jgi:hypothetical protein